MDRLERLEDKVDRIEDVVVEIRTDMKHYNEKVESHLLSDAGIIKTIAPILDKLPQIVEIAEAYQFEKKLKERKKEAFRYYTTRIGVFATVVGMSLGVIRLFI